MTRTCAYNQRGAASYRKDSIKDCPVPVWPFAPALVPEGVLQFKTALAELTMSQVRLVQLMARARSHIKLLRNGGLSPSFFAFVRPEDFHGDHGLHGFPALSSAVTSASKCKHTERAAPSSVAIVTTELTGSLPELPPGISSHHHHYRHTRFVSLSPLSHTQAEDRQDATHHQFLDSVSTRLPANRAGTSSVKVFAQRRHQHEGIALKLLVP